MPNRKQNRRKRRSNKNRANKMGYLDPSYTHTLTQEVDLTTLTSLSTWNTITWPGLQGFNVFSDFFQYFKPVSYRIVGIDTSAASVSHPVVSAFYPINYIVEAALTPVLTSAATLSEIRGSILYQTGSNNKGQWQAWPPLQQNLSCQDARTATSPAGQLITQFQGGTSTSLTVLLEINVRFFRRYPIQGLGALPVLDLEESKQEQDEEDPIPRLTQSSIEKYEIIKKSRQ